MMQVINFNIPPQSVELSLVKDKEYVLKYEKVRLDASGSKIIGYSSAGDSGNLTYEWVCPTNDSFNICRQAEGPVLEILSYMIPLNFLNYFYAISTILLSLDIFVKLTSFVNS